MSISKTYQWSATAIALLILVSPFVCTIYLVQGDSMAYALRSKDILLIERVSLQMLSPRHGEIIALRNPHKPSEIVVKRVIGLPGETMHVHDSDVVIVHVDGSEETFSKDTLMGAGSAGENTLNFDMALGPSDYFVLGDNRQSSLDSRIFGAVQPQDFIGRPLLRVFPLSQFTVLLFNRAV